MFTLRQTLPAALLALSGTLLGSGAHAAQPGFDFTLDNNGLVTITRPTTGTTTGSLLATFTNLSGSPVSVFGVGIAAPYDAANDTFPAVLNVGPSGFLQTFAASSVFHGDFADFTITSMTPLGLYNINGIGGSPYANLITSNQIISRNYSVNIVPATAPAVPEPSSFAVLGIGTLGLALLVLRRRKATGV